MYTLRRYLGWLFAFTSLVCTQIGFSVTLTAIRQQHHFYSIYGNWSRSLLFAAPLMMVSFAFVFGMAWWTTFKERPSARGWGIAASLINLQLALFPVIFPPHSILNGFLLLLAVAVMGLVAFAKKVDTAAPPSGTQVGRSLPADGTNALLNKSVQVLMLAAAVLGYHWWSNWVRNHHISATQNNLSQFFIFTCIGLVIATTHELGHSVVGLALGMKLRSFLVGPFHWQIREGRWEFNFDPKQILAGGGKTGVVPPRPDFPRWSQLFVSAGGVFANLVTGLSALAIAWSTSSESSLQTGGLLELFGIWSVILGSMNLIPFRIGYNYSDGAQIYQLLSNGPWSDLHRVLTVAGSSLVTAIRPRDYDIGAILRAAGAIKAGFQGFILRLLASDYFLDHGRVQEASEYVQEAGVIYDESASSEVSPELLTALVFGCAYLCRDATLTEQWWMQMSAKNPTRFNVDYWLAASAHQWMAGNLGDANECAEKAAELARDLPDFGAYEFDRYRCAVLLRAVREVSATA